MAQRSVHGSPATIDTQVCIAGGGPAGIVCGLLLAAAGVDVVVLEKHADFNRDFRGDTVHPSTLELLHELGWLDEFLSLPHTEMPRVRVSAGGQELTLADMSRLPTRCRFVAFVPQWEFLDFLAKKGREFPGFRLVMDAEAVAPVWDRTGERGDRRANSPGSGGARTIRAGGTGSAHRLRPRVAGIRAVTPDGPATVTADLVIAADGRHSALRAAARLPLVKGSAPMDVLWLRLPRRRGESLPLFTAGAAVVICIDRGHYWQIAYTIPVGGLAAAEALGLDGLSRSIAHDRPELADRVAALLTWDDVHELRVSVDHLGRWHAPGLLCIGDAAHAMSPAGGVGINLAVQDAVATANALAPVFSAGSPSAGPSTAGPLSTGATTNGSCAAGSVADPAPVDPVEIDRALARVQRRREPAARITQAFQALALRGMHPRPARPDSHPVGRSAKPSTASPAADSPSCPVPTARTAPPGIPPAFRVLKRVPVLRHLAGRFIGLGVRPEHVSFPPHRGGISAEWRHSRADSPPPRDVASTMRREN